MFFGQEVKQNQNKASVVTMDSDVHLSQAVLDPASKGNKKEPVCLMAEIQGKSFILAVLDPSQSWQCPLDLMLVAGTEVKFFLRGQGNVHLTGYELPEEEDDFEMSMSSSDEEMMDEPEEEANSKHAAKKIKTKSSPGKAKNSPAKTNGVKPSNNVGAKPSNNVGAKPSADQSSDDDDDSDDEDLSFGSEDDEEVGDSDDSDMDDVDLDGLSSDDGADDDDDDENGNNDDDDDVDDEDDDSDY